MAIIWSKYGERNPRDVFCSCTAIKNAKDIPRLYATSSFQPSISVFTVGEEILRLIHFMIRRMIKLARPSMSWKRETCPLSIELPPERSFSITLVRTLTVTEVIIMFLIKIKKDST